MTVKPIREFFPAQKIAEELHVAYEQASKEYGWKTQKKCQVSFDKLPEKNKEVMIRMAYLVQDMIEEECQKAIVDYLEDESKTILQGFEMSWQQAKPCFQRWVKTWLGERYTRVKLREQQFT
jgi:shikimate 5-dehydrogenase